MAIALAIGLLLVLDGLYVGVRSYLALSNVRDGLNAAEAALRGGRIGEAESTLVDAKSAAEIAVDQTHHPSFFIAKVIPGLSSDARAIQAMSVAARLSAEAGLTIIRAPALQAAGEKPIAHTIYPGGRVDFGVIDQLGPRMQQVQARLEEAHALVRDAPNPLIGPVNAAVDTARTRLREASDAALRGGVLMDALPSLLARGSSKQYLLAFQTPSEARAGGGLLGVYGVLEARHGRLQLTKIEPIGDLIRRGPVRVDQAPRWFKRTYGDLGALRQYQQANLSPHFPVTARAWLDMYEDSTGKRLDGVLAMDPIALGELTRGTGPVRGPGLDVDVTADTASRILLHDSYTQFDSRQDQDAYLAGLVDNLWRRINDDTLDAGGLMEGLAQSVTGQHLKFLAVGSADQTALAELEADGDYSKYGPNVQVVFNNNNGVNKIDYFLQRSLDTSIALNSDGTATVTTTAQLTNTAPTTGGPSLMRGPGIGGIHQPGLNAMLLHVLMPEDSRLMRFEIDGRRRPPFRGSEESHPVVYDLFDIPPQSSRQLMVVYRLQKAFVPASRIDFSFTVVPQATVNPDEFKVSITSPDGYSIVGDESVSRQETASGLLTEPRTVSVTLEQQ